MVCTSSTCATWRVAGAVLRGADLGRPKFSVLLQGGDMASSLETIGGEGLLGCSVGTTGSGLGHRGGRIDQIAWADFRPIPATPFPLSTEWVHSVLVVLAYFAFERVLGRYIRGSAIETRV